MKKTLLVIVALICFSTASNSQILNGGFENWTAGLPDNWWGVLFPPYDLLTQSTSAHSGSYAVRLHIDDLGGGQPFGTPLSTGNGVVTTHPLTFVPHSVSFWYKLNSIGGDELTITALVYSGGTGSGVAVVAFPAAASYTYISTTIQYGVVPANADSIAIIVLITHPSGTTHIGSEAFIDDIGISTSTGINNLSAVNNFQILPNPANKFISIELPSIVNKTSEILITDATGRLVHSQTVYNAEKEAMIETTSFRTGIYFCTVKSGELESRKTVVIIHP